MTFSSEELSQLNREGLIAGPGESEADFTDRVTYCKNLQQHLDMPSADVSEAEPLTKHWFDITPKWVPCFFSNHQLSFWHGGCAWIFQKDDHTPTGAFLQLRKTFQESKSFLGIYMRDEFIAHELCHVGRMMFQEPKYEEVIAYQSASSSFQRFFGPVIRSSTEAIIFTVILMMIVLTDIMVIMTDSYSLYQKLIWVKAIPVLLIIFALGRLFWTQAKFKRCRRNLGKILGSEALINAVVFRLTDSEIDQFSTLAPDEIRAYGESASQRDLRWKQIFPYLLS